MFTNIEEYQEKPGSKLNVLIALLRHFLEDDRAGPVEWDSTLKTIVYPKIPTGEGKTQKKKILVYFAFTMMAKTLISVRYSMLESAECYNIVLGFESPRNPCVAPEWPTKTG